MKGTFQIFTRRPPYTRFGIFLVVCLLAARPLSNGAPLASARVSAVIHDVRLLPSNAAPRPAAVNDNVGQGTAVRTGTESRAELTFADLTVTRLGENTIFSFDERARELNVTKGAILLEVPSKAPPAKINTAAVTAAVMGGTGLFATGPPVKFMVLEGIGTFYPAGHPERAMTVHAGEMVMMTANGRITQPTKFNVQLVLETSHLIVDFPDLANLPLILDVVNQQLAEESAGTLNPLPSKNPLDVIDVLTQNVTANPAVVAFTAPPTPSLIGPPVIRSPVPYVINNGTTIVTLVTHPTITTNGVTDSGKIYRGQSIDGPLSAFLFGSTSGFDTASGFDTLVGGGGGGGIGGNGTGAAFKFTSLELAGDPTVSTTNGEINLGLVGINGITSGAPGGTLTFAGIRGLLLATQDGPITLGPEISFSGLHDINIYARGSSSDLTLGSDINTSRRVFLLAERDMSMTSNITTEVLLAEAGRNITLSDPAIIHAETITLSAGQNLTWNGQTSDETAANSDGDVNISAGQAINIANDLNITRHNGGFGSGLNVALSAGTDLTVGNNLTIEVDNSMGGSLDAGANITLNTGGNVAVNGSGGIGVTVQNTAGTISNGGNITLTTKGGISTQALGLLVENYDETAHPAGHIGTGGNISVTIGGDLTASSVDVFINNRAGGMIDSGGNLTFDVGGALKTTGDAGFIIESRFDSSAGNTIGSTIGSDVTLEVRAGSVNIGGFLGSDSFTGAPFTGISNRGSTINGSATYRWDILGDVTVQGDGDMEILNDGHSDFEADGGGTIHGNATLQIGAKNFTANSLFTQINNRSGGVIDSSATLSFNLSGSFAIPGTTPGNALAVVAPGEADLEILNEARPTAPAGVGGGFIGSNATINLSAANISIGSVGLFSDIVNGTGSTAGGSIGSDATINVTTTNISDGGALDATIDNISGSIGGKATINMNVSGTANVTGDATFEILGSNGAVSGAAINFNGGSYAVGGTFLGVIDGDGAITFNNSSIRADIVKVGVFGTNGTLTIGGGAISANTLLKLYAPGNNGTLNFVANVTLSSGTAANLAAKTITIQPSVLVTIAGNGGPANIFTSNPNYNFTPGRGYTGPPGNPSNGSFGGPNGALDPQPLANAPLFSDPPASSPGGAANVGTQTLSSAKVTWSGRANGGLNGARQKSGEPTVSNGKVTGATINVGSSAELLSLLDAAAPGPGGKISIPASKSASNSRNSNRRNADGRLKANRSTVDTRHLRDRADNPPRLASARSFAP
jgi:FecR protein